MATLTRKPRPVKPARAHVVSLALAIDHQCYGVTPIKGIQDPDVTRAFRLEKKSDRDAVYDVCRTALGFVSCSCPDYVARHEGNGFGLCKHGRALVELGLLDAPGAAAIAPAPAVCCDPAEPAPCAACESAPAPDPRRVVEGPGPAGWPAWTDAERFVPADADRAWHEARARAEADDDDDPGEPAEPRLTLAELITATANEILDRGGPVNNLMAESLAALARVVELTHAQDVATHLDRIAALDRMAECDRSGVGR